MACDDDSQHSSLFVLPSCAGADGSWVDLLSTTPQQPGLRRVWRPHPFHPDMQVC